MTIPIFPKLSDEEMKRRLQPPDGPVRMVFDTDCRNEIDDQFALAWGLLSENEIHVEACYAEPYSHECYRKSLAKAYEMISSSNEIHATDDKSKDNHIRFETDDGPRSQRLENWARVLYSQGIHPQDLEIDGPAIGMEKSYDEILHIYELLDKSAEGKAFRGADRYLTSYDNPVVSASTEDLIQRANEYKDEPLFVAAIGCVTNIASALLLEPDLVRKIVVLWTAAYPTSARAPNSSFNLDQDILAAQLLFDSGVPHVYLPGYHVGAQLTLSLPDMEAWIRDKGKLGNYLFNEYMVWHKIRQESATSNSNKGNIPRPDMRGYTKVIWDLINVAWLINPSYVPTELLRAPRFGNDTHWHHDQPHRHWMREAYAIDRDGIFLNLIQKFERAP